MFCLLVPALGHTCDWTRLAFDLDGIGFDGLMGPPDGKRYLDYEFCAPADLATLRRLQGISPTLRCHPGASGRSACHPGQALCIGSTESPHWRVDLCRLTTLPFVQQVLPTWWE